MEPSAASQTRITHQALDTLFPMHVILDASGTIVQVGPTLQKIMCRELCGLPFLDAFSVKNPDQSPTLHA